MVLFSSWWDSIVAWKNTSTATETQRAGFKRRLPVLCRTNDKITLTAVCRVRWRKDRCWPSRRICHRQGWRKGHSEDIDIHFSLVNSYVISHFHWCKHGLLTCLCGAWGQTADKQEQKWHAEVWVQSKGNGSFWSCWASGEVLVYSRTLRLYSRVCLISNKEELPWSFITMSATCFTEFCKGNESSI